MFGFFKKRRAIKSFVRDMGPALRQEFGKKPHYSAEEVRKVGNRVGSNSDYMPYAFCMFCTPMVFDSLYHGSSHNYDAMREEVGSTFFGGDTSFNADTVIEAGESFPDSGSSGGDSGGGWDSGGGGGGGDSGCGGGGGD
jgi:hypothetical protein